MKNIAKLALVLGTLALGSTGVAFAGKCHGPAGKDGKPTEIAADSEQACKDKKGTWSETHHDGHDGHKKTEKKTEKKEGGW